MSEGIYKKPVAKWSKMIGIAASIALNLAFLTRFAMERLNAPPDRLGVTTQEIEVGDFNGGGPYFKLPKGLPVRDSSPQGLDAIDLFEPHRFQLTITTDNEHLVDYSGSTKNREGFGDLYSADWKQNHAQK